MPDLSFASSLLADHCHNSLVNLGESEIKTIDNLKIYLSKHVSIIENYSHSLKKLNANCDISNFGLDEDSPFVKGWQVFYSENMQVTAIFNQMASNISSSILPRLEKLLSHMKEVHKQYKTQRFRVDSELKTVCDQENRLKTTYQQHAQDVANAKSRLENSSKAKTDKAKLRKAYLKLYQNHNEYVLAIQAATIHQNHYESGIVPNLMNSLQSIKQDLVNDWKSILVELSEPIKAYAQQNAQLADALVTSMNRINNDNPYEPFIENKGSCYEPHPGFIFDESLLSIANTELMENEVEVNDLTFEQLKSKNMLLEKAVDETKSDLSVKSSEYQAAKNLLIELKEQISNGDLTPSLFVKQMAVADLSRKLKELSCNHEKAVAQKEIVNSSLEKLNGQPPPPFVDPGHNHVLDVPVSPNDKKTSRTLPGFNTLRKKSDDSQTSAETNRLSRSLQYSNHHRPLPITPTEAEDNEDVYDIDDYDEPVEVPLEEELWYHANISRPDTEASLQVDGDYLVRASNRKPGNYVLSVKWGGYRHFMIQRDESGKFRLEGESYATVTHLIEYHKKNQIEVTKKSSALLKNPILRSNPSRNLSHDNIIIQTKLGRGHFGDVMKGRIRDTGEEVAVKTCRDVATMKEKFLQEAEILAQYNHPNIVKLIGVAAEQEPVYIVMELMAGGDFLNYLRKNGGEIERPELLQYGIDAASGMQYLESKGCIHRDLAARNCLLDKTKILKISDFGMSRETDVYECSNMREIPVKWTAPEALNFSQYTSASDVWSFGVLLWETYSMGNTPYPGMNNKDTREQVDRGYRMPPPAGTPPVVYDLMKECWQKNPEDRPTFHGILIKMKQISKRL